MAQYHTHDASPTVVQDETGPGVFLAVVAIVMVGFLIWLFAFSGLVFDRNGDTAPAPNQPNIEQNFEQNNPPAQQQQPQQPAPGMS